MTIDGKARYRSRRLRSGDPPPFQLTPRDVDVLRAVARFRFLHSGHIAALIPGSDKNIRIRLKLLFEHGLLDRPACQFETYRLGGGSSLAVYALGDKGARLLDGAGDSGEHRSVSWSHKNRNAGRPFLAHTLAIADFAVALTVDAARRTDVELVDGDALLARFPDAARDAPKPLCMSVPVVVDGTSRFVGLEPDYAFSLGFPLIRQRANYLVEIDRGTMPVERAGVAATSILRKLVAYREVWRSALHTSRFGWRSFRVLVVTTEPGRAANMRAAAARHLGAADAALFWFADRTSVAGTGALACPWIDGTGTSRCIAAG